MPIFQFRLEAQDGSGHFRQGAIEADSEEQARMVLEERERDRAAFRLSEERIAEICKAYQLSPAGLAAAAEKLAANPPKDGEEMLDELVDAVVNHSIDDLPVAAARDASPEAKAAFRALPVRDRAHLNAHRQDQPYVLVAIAEREG